MTLRDRWNRQSRSTQLAAGMAIAVVVVALIVVAAVAGGGEEQAAAPTVTSQPQLQPQVTAPPATGSPTPAPSPTPVGVVLTVANTDGTGAFLRRTPSLADTIKAWPDGTAMTVVGADRQAEGRTWRNVRDPDGTVGWMPAEYLIGGGQTAPTPPTLPTPSPAVTATAQAGTLTPVPLTPTPGPRTGATPFSSGGLGLSREE